MNDDLINLASAYLDGDVTADERRRVESDAALLAEVERLRQVRALLGATEPAPISMRERHLAAALEAWDRLPTAERTGRDATPAGVDAAAVAGAATISAPTPLERRRPRRERRWSSTVLAAAAAVVVVAGAGVVINGALGSGTDDSNDAAVNVETDDAGPLADLEERAADETFGDAATADEPPAELATEIAEDGALLAPADAPLNAELVVLRSPDDVADFAAAAIGAPAAVPSPEAEEIIVAEGADDDAGGAEAAEESAADDATPLCGLDQLVDLAIYAGDGIEETVAVGLDLARGEAVAYRVDDCSVVVRAPLPNG